MCVVKSLYTDFSEFLSKSLYTDFSEFLSRTVTRLDLTNNGVGDPGAGALAAMLRHKF